MSREKSPESSAVQRNLPNQVPIDECHVMYNGFEGEPTAGSSGLRGGHGESINAINPHSIQRPQRVSNCPVRAH